MTSIMQAAPAAEAIALAPEANAQERIRRIREAAYFRAERRGFAAGDAESDWLEAEREVDAQLRAAGSAARPAPLQEIEAQLVRLRALIGRRRGAPRQRFEREYERLAARMTALLAHWGVPGAPLAPARQAHIDEELAQLRAAAQSVCEAAAIVSPRTARAASRAASVPHRSAPNTPAPAAAR